ncbi:LuxR family transcriptional regulator [Egibacter rhizosphaerae]|uniref:LuxR family transcriptional regulator n=1 Tax=Egibacter rhizosphaerae TaxID=1670831 RepID=A0A411YIY1_9ACTN|nr:LuxR family transcriptional regulator [Egibacter rhizosphaerae]QBI21265.1 LuxR family transcriptional regulator [Egibacter rhizosphaerae]
MSGEADTAVARGERALAAGDWTAAVDAFGAALERAETPEALAGYGEALWWLGENHEGMAYRERGYVAFRHEGNPERAVDVALWLCKNHLATLGNPAAARGWLARARRLVDEHGLEEWHGWVRLMEAYDADAAEGEALAREAHELARARADADMELCALAGVGGALVGQGRVTEGVGYLDEAMAGALAGEGRHRDTVVFTSCTTIIACTTCAEFERAVQWVRATDRFTRRYGCPFLYVQCRVLYAAVLFATGDWDRAEEELHTVLRASEGALPALRAEGLATLAELRLAQGRLEEAGRLVEGLEDQSAAVPVLAGLHLAHGRASTAEALLRRCVGEVGDSLEALGFLELLGEAARVGGRVDEAQDRGRALAERGASLGCDLAVARGARLQGQALAEVSPEEARRHLEEALATFGRLGMPVEAARTRLRLASLLRSHLPELAADEARTALDVLEGVGASRDAAAASDLLRELGVAVARRGPRSLEILTHREQEVFTLLGEGLSNPDIAERLYISRRTAEQHVARVLRKLGLRSRAEAAAEATRQSHRAPPRFGAR